MITSGRVDQMGNAGVGCVSRCDWRTGVVVLGEIEREGNSVCVECREPTWTCT